jgi:hypothetical protein
MNVEAVCHIRVGKFLRRNRNGQADIDALRLGRAAIGCFHNAGTTARTDDKPSAVVPKALRPPGQP